MNREMKDSGSQWIQDIPNKWNNERLKYTITARDGGAWGEEPTKDNPGVICMRIADFNYDDGVFQDKPQEQLTKRLYTNNQINRLMLMQNDICIEKSGGGEKTPVGRTVIFDKAYPALFANFMERLRFNPNIIIPHFGEYWFRAMYSCKVSPVYIKQTTGIQNLDVGTMLAVERIYYPSLPEQRQIVHFLDRKCAAIDTAIEKTKESIEKLEEYKKAVITKAVTKGLDPDAKMKDSGIEGLGMIPDTWSVCPMKTLFSFGKGLSITKDDLTENGKPVLSYGQIHSKTNPKVSTPDELLRYVPEDKAKIQSLTSIGDFIFADTSEDRDGCGNCNYIDTEGIYAGYHTIIAKAKGITDNKYFGYLFGTDAWRFQMRRELTEVKLYSVSQKVLKNTVILLPTDSDRNRIVTFLDKKCKSIDTLISKKVETISKWEEYKKSLIYYAVTGKIDCRNEAV